MNYFLTLVLTLSSCYCSAQFQRFSDDIFFKKFSTQHGLSHASVNAVLRDSKGFIWLGTDEGLNRFDGKIFRVFRNQPNDSTSLVGNAIHSLWEDPSDRIWVGTMEGLNRFDRHLERFTSLPIAGVESYACYDFRYVKANNRLWMANGIHGLNFVDISKDKVQRFPHPALENTTVIRIEVVGTSIYIGTLENGLLKLDTEKGTITPITLGDHRSKTSNSPYAIRALRAEDNTTLWIGTEGGGLKKLNTLSGEIITYSKAKGQLLNDKVWAIEPEGHRTWVGTDGGGVSVLNTKTLKSHHYQHSDFNARTISSNTIRTILKDNRGDIWFGTLNGGVNYLPDFSIKFHIFKKDPDNAFSLSHNAVLSFFERGDGTLLVGTDGGGLQYMKDGKFFPYKFPPGVEKPDVILSILELENGGVLLGTYQQGLYYISSDRRVKQLRSDPNDTTTLTSDIIWDMEEDYAGNVWLATEAGINRIDPYSWKITNYRNHGSTEIPEVFTREFSQTIMMDSSYTLWAGQVGNIRSFDLTTGEVANYSSDTTKHHEIPNKQILSLKMDARNKEVAWCSAFGEGLVRVDLKRKRFDLINNDDGLPNTQILAVQSDHQGMVWMSTPDGVVRYDPYQKTFFVFEQDFGINISPFAENAGGITTSGYILFGGTNGFTAFWPRDIQFEKSNLNVTFTGFQLFNTEVPIDNTILKKSITETKLIRLEADQARFMTFEFSAPQFLAPSTIQYQYMLKGFEDQWSVINDKQITFTNLLPGNYKLRVKAGFASAFTGRETILEIIVVPPWWTTPAAKVCFVIFLAGVAYGFYRYRIYRLNKRKKELERIVSKQNQEIIAKNGALASQNEKLSTHNEQLLKHRSTISLQNHMLFEAQEQLKEINHSLESQVQQRTEKLNETITQLNKTIKELDAFLYSASHDLASPLKSILGLVNLAKLEKPDAITHSYLDHIEKSVRKLEGVIQTLMQHSFNTKAEAQVQKIHLKVLTLETIDELRFTDDAKQIKFQYELDDANVVADPTRLKIILSNLISNAIKYRDPAKKKNNVNVSFKRNAQTWMLEILDNGIGIEKTRVERVFEMFYRATESAKGSGLGLYIVKDTVERLGGKIEAQSELGKWTRFTVTFPEKHKKFPISELTL
jgi:signal transduction histidine kinase/ligand-binding sensor domain-containing protein